MKVVIAPDSFKGSASAARIAAAVAAGWRGVRQTDDVVECPMGDGGEGTLDVFASAEPASRRIPVTVTGPDDQTVLAEYLLLPDGGAVVELAGMSGLALTDRRRPLHAHTRGFGQAIVAALDAGATRLVLGVGGSGTTDGGAGMLRELGARLLDEEEVELGDGGGELLRLARVDLSAMRPLPRNGVRVLSDVRSPLVGPHGAARMFAPQKGASAGDVELLECGLRRYAEVLGTEAAVPGAGAAGGTAYALLAWGAQLTPGSAAVAEAIGLPGQIDAADFVVTGEGRFDGQSELGKVPACVRHLAGERGLPVGLVAGLIDVEPRGFAAAVSLVDLAGSTAESLANPERFSRLAGAVLATTMAHQSRL